MRKKGGKAISGQKLSASKKSFDQHQGRKEGASDEKLLSAEPFNIKDRMTHGKNKTKKRWGERRKRSRKKNHNNLEGEGKELIKNLLTR